MAHQFAWIFLLVLLDQGVFAETVSLTVSRLFTNGAVLQRERPVAVWGRAAPGTAITVQFGPSSVGTVTDPTGRWLVELPAMQAETEGRDLLVQSQDGQQKVFEDVVVGDLWFCAGQSNMELGMASIMDRSKELKDLKYPGLRLYLIPKSASGLPREEVFGAWVHSDRQSVTVGGWNGFSAVAYTFGRALVRELGVPVGVIQAAYGGSSILPWLSPQELRTDPAYAKIQTQLLQVEEAFLAARKANPKAKHPYDDPSDSRELGPASIYHAMLEPLRPLAIKGVLWYQGESNVGEGPLYTQKMNSLITGWRRLFAQPDLPFYFVQLPPWEGYGGDSLPRMWLAQTAVLSTPGTGMVVTVDVGDFGNIHPENKRPVGERLARQALSKTYGRQDVMADGPVFRSWKPTQGGVQIEFLVTGALATIDGGAPRGFEVLDQGGSWSTAKATIVGGSVVLEAKPGAKSVRYAWSSTPQVNLTDDSLLPARPFFGEQD